MPAGGSDGHEDGASLWLIVTLIIAALMVFIAMLLLVN